MDVSRWLPVTRGELLKLMSYVDDIDHDIVKKLLKRAYSFVLYFFLIRLTIYSILGGLIIYFQRSSGEGNYLSIILVSGGVLLFIEFFKSYFLNAYISHDFNTFYYRYLNKFSSQAKKFINKDIKVWNQFYSDINNYLFDLSGMLTIFLQVVFVSITVFALQVDIRIKVLIMLTGIGVILLLAVFGYIYVNVSTRIRNSNVDDITINS